MSAEFQPKPAERTAERENGLEELARERLEEIKHAEQSPEHKPAHERAAEARSIIDQAERPKEPVAAVEEQSPAKPKYLPILDPMLNYKHTVASLQRHLKPVSRSFSRVIHQPVIERTSEALEKTVARPSILNGALWMAALIGTVFYIFARQYGYQLSGSEMLFALIAGAGIGLVGEVIWRAFKQG